ncbi:MAG: hypothetical protein V3W34_01480 [Phycisphaerae bacterium]
MTIEQLRKTHRAQPFEPFVLRTADGREFEVNHPEVLAISPVGRTVVVMAPDGAHDVIDLLLVASLHMTNHKPRRRRKRS